jgi:transcriptional regulator with XRE-family HTH domain
VNAIPAPEVQAKIVALGAQIVAERSAAGVSQEALAEQLGIHPNTMRNYEKGKRDIPYGLLEQMAELLGIKVSRLVSLAEERLERATPSD